MNLWFCLATKGGVQRKRDQSASAFRAEASCRSPVSLAKNKPWVETRGFLPSYLSASFSRLFHHPALLPLPAAEPRSKAAQSGGLTFAARGRKNPETQAHLLNSSDEQGPSDPSGALFLIYPMMLKVGDKL